MYFERRISIHPCSFKKRVLEKNLIEQLKKLTFPFSQMKKEQTHQFMINYSFFSAIG
jgi:hypothetical protein